MILRSRPLRTATAVVCATVLATGLAACGGGSKKKAAPAPTSSSVTPTPSPSTSSAAPKAAPINPLTGGTPNTNSVVAVKIDDVAAGRPQVGIDRADIVYVEQVEGGLTRLVALFNTAKPTKVGPVRSVRSNDPELLSQYGAIGFVASGGGGDSLPALDHSILKADINDRGGPGFFRDGNRPAPHNLFVDLTQALPHAGHAQSNGWTWSASTAGLRGTPTVSSLSTVVGGTQVRFVYNARTGRWERVIDGVVQTAADGATISTPNVIVQYCQGYTNAKDIDPAGNPGHFTKSIGHDRVFVYRNGHRVAGTWTRTSLTGGTVLTDVNRKPIPLAPGGAWVILVTDGAPLS